MNVVWAESLSKKFVPQSKSLHSSIPMPSVAVRAAGRSIRFGCGLFRSQVDASNCSLGLFISLFFPVLWKQTRPAGRPMSSTVAVWPDGLCQLASKIMSVSKVSQQHIALLSSFFFFLWERLPSRAAVNSSDVGQLAISSASCNWTDHCLEFLLFFCSDDASVLHLCCVFFYMCWCQPLTW